MTEGSSQDSGPPAVTQGEDGVQQTQLMWPCHPGRPSLEGQLQGGDCHTPQMVGSGKDTYGYRGLQLLSQRSGSSILISVILFPNAEGKYAHNRPSERDNTGTVF